MLITVVGKFITEVRAQLYTAEVPRGKNKV